MPNVTPPRSPSNEVLCQAYIDTRLEAYSSFFDHTWCREIFSLSEGTRLFSVIGNLATAWRGTSNAMRLPLLMMLIVESYHEGFVGAEPPLPSLISDRLNEILLKGIDLSHTKRKQIRERIGLLGKELNAIRGLKVPFERDALWKGLYSNQEMWMSLWSSQQLCYGSLYYAYENFVRESISVAKRDPNFMLTGNSNQLREKIDSVFGPSTAGFLIGQPEIQIARETRNALVHAGGKETARMRQMKHKLTISGDGRICIMPDDIRQLHEILKKNVTTFVQKHATHAPFA